MGEQILAALQTGAGMLWKALWALVFGYLISAAIQVLVSRGQMAQMLGERGLKRAGLASLFGFISSSCSFAALAASRSVLAKGAHPANGLAFLIASTNLVIELGIVLLVLLGWKFALANILLGLLMIAYAYALSRLWFPMGLAEQAREHARAVQGEEAQQESMNGDDGTWRQQLTSRSGWHRIANAFFMEWKMAYKEILFGFTIAGFITVFVPQAFWDALFLRSSDGDPSFWVLIENALVAPVVAFFTFIGSMGNVPLAAMLWSKGAAFAGVMSFLGADLVAATVIYIHAKYYGWKYALFLSALLYVCMVAAGLSVHGLYAALGAIPEERTSVQEMVRFDVDYTLWLNLLFLAIAVALFLLRRSSNNRRRSSPRAAAGDNA